MQGNLTISISQESISQIEQIIRKVLSEKEIQQDKLLSSEEVMQLLGISTTTLQKWRNDGKIPFTRIDNKIFYSKAEVLQALSETKALSLKS